MAQITTINHVAWEATFNRQQYRITKSRSDLVVERVQPVLLDVRQKADRR